LDTQGCVQGYYLRADVAASNNKTAAESSNASIDAAKVRAMKAGGMVATEIAKALKIGWSIGVSGTELGSS
jgi:hypothetical protein